MIRLLILTLLVTTMSSCIYRMPQEDEFSTVPLTNNPNITKDKGKIAIPGVN